jgi:hypothetical protein
MIVPKANDRTELTAREVIGDESIRELIAVDGRWSKDGRIRKFFSNSEFTSVLEFQWSCTQMHRSKKYQDLLSIEESEMVCER